MIIVSSTSERISMSRQWLKSITIPSISLLFALSASLASADTLSVWSRRIVVSASPLPTIGLGYEVRKDLGIGSISGLINYSFAYDRRNYTYSKASDYQITHPDSLTYYYSRELKFDLYMHRLGINFSPMFRLTEHSSMGVQVWSEVSCTREVGKESRQYVITRNDLQTYDYWLLYFDWDILASGLKYSYKWNRTELSILATWPLDVALGFSFRL